MTTRTTRTVRSSVATDSAFGAVMPPIYLSSNFQFAELGETPEYDYTRSGNPTRSQLAHALADLEGGSTAVPTATGMGAASVVTNLVGPEDLVLCTVDCYGGTRRLLDALAACGKLRVEYADLSCPHRLAAGLQRNPRLIWVETPSNPLLQITDLRRVVDGAKRIGALTLADNTFLSPVLQRPLEHGFDLVIHSTTKFINGHSDVVGGAVIAASDELGEEIGWWANCIGVTQSPFDSYMTLRGMRTLHARMEQHQRGTEAVVQALKEHPAVNRVHFPGLPDHPGHLLAKSQQDGFGSMVSFEIEGGFEAAKQLVSHLNLFVLAESLGGVESLVCHPATMTHSAITDEARAEAGIGEGLLRFSVGLESAEDLVLDLTGALDRLLTTTTSGHGASRRVDQTDIIPISLAAARR